MVLVPFPCFRDQNRDPYPNPFIKNKKNNKNYYINNVFYDFHLKLDLAGSKIPALLYGLT